MSETEWVRLLAVHSNTHLGTARVLPPSATIPHCFFLFDGRSVTRLCSPSRTAETGETARRSQWGVQRRRSCRVRQTDQQRVERADGGCLGGKQSASGHDPPPPTDAAVCSGAPVHLCCGCCCSFLSLCGFRSIRSVCTDLNRIVVAARHGHVFACNRATLRAVNGAGRRR